MRAIEIKNKRMILFREDRLIGAKGDVNTAVRKFVLDVMQGETDLSEMVAWIKIDPKIPTESPYDQLLKKEIIGDKVVLTWQLTAKNLQRAGEISVQVIFASPAYFVEDELDKIFGDSPFLPSPVEGNSAPVWQCYPEIFVIEESIDNTVGYKEVTKNVLVSAVAEAVSSAESSQSAAESAQQAAQAAARTEESVLSMSNDVENKQEVIEREYSEIMSGKQEVLQNLEASREYSLKAEQKSDEAMQASLDAQSYMQKAQESRDAALECKDEVIECYDYAYEASRESMAYANQAGDKVKEAQAQATSARAAKDEARSILEKVKKARNFRLIYTTTLTADDTDCYSFEVTEDTEGNPFSLSEFVIFMHFPMMAGTGSSYIKTNIRLSNSTSTSFYTIAQFAALSSTKDNYLRVEHKNMGRWITNVLKGTSWSQNADELKMSSSVSNVSRSTDNKYAAAIRLSQHANVGVPFPEGTLIEIWGIDAIEEAE